MKSLRIRSFPVQNAGKIRARKSLNTDTFHTVNDVSEAAFYIYNKQ